MQTDANATDIRQSRPWQHGDDSVHRETSKGGKANDAVASGQGSPWEFEPRLDRVVHGMADQVDRTESIGDGQVPAVVALAWTILS